MPNALLQGAAMQLPCVASDVRGNKDAVIHGVTGYLYKLHNTKELVELTNTLINNPYLRSIMGKEGREFIKREYDTKIVCKRLLNFYYDTLSMGSCGGISK